MHSASAYHAIQSDITVKMFTENLNSVKTYRPNEIKGTRSPAVAERPRERAVS